MYRFVTDFVSHESLILLYELVTLLFLFSCGYAYIGYILHDTRLMAAMHLLMLLSGFVSIGIRLLIHSRKLK